MVTTYTQHDMHPCHLSYISHWAMRWVNSAADEGEGMGEEVIYKRERLQKYTWEAKHRIMKQ